MRESISWMADGACVGLDPEAWFPAPGEKVPAAVRKICQRCPVRLECAEYAINNESRIEGVWGGLSYNERVKIRYARGIRTVPVPAGMIWSPPR